MLDRKQGDPAFEAAKTAVMAMSIPTPKLPQGSMDLMPDRPAERLRIAGLPSKRAEFLLRGELRQAAGELLDANVGEIPKNLVSIQLTLDGVFNLRFINQVEDILRLEEQRVPRDMELAPPYKENALRADVTLSLVRDRTGQVVRHYTSGNDRTWSGPIAKPRKAPKHLPRLPRG